MEPASGFSHSTCLPAAMSAAAIGRCRSLPTTMLTASIEGSSTTSSQLESASSKPYRRAASRASVWSASAIAASRMGGSPSPKTVFAWRYPAAWLRPAIPAPMTATDRGPCHITGALSSGDGSMAGMRGRTGDVALFGGGPDRPDGA
jgi:hypothetical protein